MGKAANGKTYGVEGSALPALPRSASLTRCPAPVPKTVSTSSNVIYDVSHTPRPCIPFDPSVDGILNLIITERILTPLVSG